MLAIDIISIDIELNAPSDFCRGQGKYCDAGTGGRDKVRPRAEYGRGQCYRDLIGVSDSLTSVPVGFSWLPTSTLTPDKIPVPSSLTLRVATPASRQLYQQTRARIMDGRRYRLCPIREWTNRQNRRPWLRLHSGQSRSASPQSGGVVAQSLDGCNTVSGRCGQARWVHTPCWSRRIRQLSRYSDTSVPRR